MILERAAITVRDGEQEAFEAAFATARQLLDRSPGCASVQLVRGIETPTSYLLLVVWHRLEDHLDGFRNSPDFGQWRGLVGPFFAVPPEVEHFAFVAAAEPEGGPGPGPGPVHPPA